MHRRDFLTGATALGLAAAVPCRAGRAQGADWEAVIAAAKQEGKVVVYSAHVGATFNQDIARAFEKKYGVTVEILEARASEIRERIRTEQAAGRSSADVSHNGATTTGLQAESGTFQPHGGLPNLANLTAPFVADELRVPIFVISYAILINTRLVKPQDEPRSWTDLADPKWKGKIIADDMRALGGGAVLFFATEEKLGRGVHERLAQQQIHFSRDIRDSERRVARGEFAIWIPQTLSNVPGLKSLPVKLVIPSEGCPYITYEAAMLKGAPHPNAARLLMNFYLSEEVQTIYGNGANGIVIAKYADRLRPDVRDLAGAKLLGTTDYRKQNEMLALAKEIYG